MAKAVVPSRERRSIMGRSFGNLEAKDSRCANIQRCCTATSSASWRMKATGSDKTRYKTLSALILILLAMTVQNYNKKHIPPKRKSTYSVFGVQKTLFPRKIYPNRDNSFSLITESSGLSDRRCGVSPHPNEYVGYAVGYRISYISKIRNQYKLQAVAEVFAS